jgi:hypothetical protein
MTREALAGSSTHKPTPGPSLGRGDTIPSTADYCPASPQRKAYIYNGFKVVIK